MCVCRSVKPDPTSGLSNHLQSGSTTETPGALPNPNRRQSLPFCHSKSVVWIESNTCHLWWWVFFRSACGRARGSRVGHSSACPLPAARHPPRSCISVCVASPLKKDVCVASRFYRLQIKQLGTIACTFVWSQKCDYWIARQVSVDPDRKRTLLAKVAAPLPTPASRQSSCSVFSPKPGAGGIFT